MEAPPKKTEAQLQKMKVAELKQHIREHNMHYAIKGYSKMTKPQLVISILDTQKRVKPAPKTAPRPAPTRPQRSTALFEFQRLVDILKAERVADLFTATKAKNRAALQSAFDKLSPDEKKAVQTTFRRQLTRFR